MVFRRIYQVDVPPDVAAAFQELAYQQRGEPEIAMSRFQRHSGGGAMFTVTENVGDLIHRMSENVNWLQGQSGTVRTKLDISLSWLTQEYGFAREHLENMRSGARHAGVPYSEFAKESKRLLLEYADAHAQLPVYNAAHYAARSAAVALGWQKYPEVIKYLKWLRKLVNDEEMYRTMVLSYKRNADGTLKSW